MEEIENKRSSKIIHFILRILSIGLSIHIILSLLFPAYFLIAGKLISRATEAYLLIGSAIFLPICVAIEAIWMGNTKSERIALLVDVLCVFILFTLVFGIILYSWTHYEMV